MHKNFYASGFFYHSPTEQILLQQKKTTIPSIWSLFGGLNLYNEDAQDTFQRIVYETLHIKLSLVSIHPIYEYFNNNMSKNHYILYTETGKMRNFRPVNGTIFEWFSFKQILKLQLSQQAKHDIVVGERVIDARMRKSLGIQTLE